MKSLLSAQSLSDILSHCLIFTAVYHLSRSVLLHSQWWWDWTHGLYTVNSVFGSFLYPSATAAAWITGVSVESLPELFVWSRPAVSVFLIILHLCLEQMLSVLLGDILFLKSRSMCIFFHLTCKSFQMLEKITGAFLMLVSRSSNLLINWVEMANGNISPLRWLL